MQRINPRYAFICWLARPRFVRSYRYLDFFFWFFISPALFYMTKHSADLDYFFFERELSNFFCQQSPQDIKVFLAHLTVYTF